MAAACGIRPKVEITWSKPLVQAFGLTPQAAAMRLKAKCAGPGGSAFLRENQQTCRSTSGNVIHHCPERPGAV